ncbi:MAG: PepSY-associated TM helix domain-containing protein [Myxococcota bacterium]
MRWRRTLVLLHRDIGFLCVGLTLVYAISGIAVNHAHHWNYNRSETAEVRARKAAIEADPTVLSRAEEAKLVEAIGRGSGREGQPRNVFWRGPDRISLFYGAGDSDTVDYNPRTGVMQHVRREDRWLLRELNFLHLNEGRGVWTYVADAFAVLLLFLAISGAVMVKGRHGLRGRGGVLAAVGLAIPVAAVLLMRHF